MGTQRLRVSDNGRYLVDAQGQPFTWLADTAWTMPQRMKADDVDYFMQRRKEQGFTVLQIVALDPERDELMRSPAGEPALIDGDLTKPNERYFAYLDWVLDRAEHYGFHVLLLPVWGQLVVGDNWMGGVFDITVDESNAYDFARWIGARYCDRNGIIWCLGGDRQPVHRGHDYRAVWRRMAEGLAAGVLGRELRFDAPREQWRDLPIAYHPSCVNQDECAAMTFWADDEPWLALDMVQSGHGGDSKNWELMAAERARPVARPVWDGEPAYEMMPTSWPPSGARHGAWTVRRRAYWSLFAGAFGYTYGHCSVWPSISEKERNEMFVEDWFEALDAEGANQLRHLRAFMDGTRIMTCVPDNGLVRQPAGETQSTELHIEACRITDDSRCYAYLPSGGRIDFAFPAGWSEAWIWWYDPRTGAVCDGTGQAMEKPARIGISAAPSSAEAEPVSLCAPTSGPGNDWVLIVSREAGDVPVQARIYHRMPESSSLDKVFDW